MGRQQRALLIYLWRSIQLSCAMQYHFTDTMAAASCCVQHACQLYKCCVTHRSWYAA